MPRERSFNVAAFCVHIYQPTNESTDLRRDLEAISQTLVAKIAHEYSNQTPPDHIHKCITFGIPVANISTAFDIYEKGAFEPGFKEIDTICLWYHGNRWSKGSRLSENTRAVGNLIIVSSMNSSRVPR